MTKWATILIGAVLAASGCTPSYRVHVNGYSELTEPIAPNARLFIAIDPNAANPIFDRQIKTSAETLLNGYGYRVADTAESADYLIRLQIGTKSETIMGYAPAYRPYFGARGGYGDGLFFGYGTYTSYVDTVYDQWLILKLFETEPDAKEPVWVGEATLNTEQAELRQTVDYLLIGCIEYLGVDTGRMVKVTIKQDDPRILSITEP